MSVATTRAKLKTELEAVSGIGTVHDYVRWSTNWSDYVAKFKSGGKINAAWIEYRTDVGDRETIANATVRNRRFKIFMIMSLDDSAATQKTFDELIDRVLTAMSPGDEHFELTVQKAEPAELVDNSMLMHGETLVHKAEIDVVVQDIIDDE